MSDRSEGKSEKDQQISPTARSLPLAKRGVVTARDFANLMGALMSDILEGRVAPEMANAVCNAGGKMLKVVEMQHRYGKRSERGDREAFVLADTSDPGESEDVADIPLPGEEGHTMPAHQTGIRDAEKTA